jgi:DNA-binding NarL/FixJ family response regulator
LVTVQQPAARDAAVRILRALGATDVLAASSIAQARRAMVGRPGEICVVEATLADGSGVTLARDLRAAGWQRVIVVATAEAASVARAAMSVGLRCFLITRPSAASATTAAGGNLAGMSHRELEVLQLVADGHSNRDVGEQLGLSALTVKSHLARIARKLGTGDRAEMVVMALRAGAIR